MNKFNDVLTVVNLALLPILTYQALNGKCLSAFVLGLVGVYVIKNAYFLFKRRKND